MFEFRVLSIGPIHCQIVFSSCFLYKKEMIVLQIWTNDQSNDLVFADVKLRSLGIQSG
jgi:hypothetical protein